LSGLKGTESFPCLLSVRWLILTLPENGPGKKRGIDGGSEGEDGHVVGFDDQRIDSWIEIE